MAHAAYRWLISDEAKPWLDLAAENLPVSPKLIACLRRGLSTEQANLVCQQAELRVRAQKKFSRAGCMYFTPVGLEQATGEQIANYKASAFPEQARVADLCCGIGGDLVSFAESSEVTGVDEDATSALLAGANLIAHGHAANQVIRTNVTELSLVDYQAWHIDPDRRPDHQRTTNINRQRPSWSVIEALLEKCAHAAIKLAPASEPPPHIASTAECEWIGTRRECKQLLVRCGDLARHPGQRTATIVDREATTIVAAGCTSIAHRAEVGAFLYESHPTLLAARIVPQVAARKQLESFALIEPSKGAAWGYLTSDDRLDPTGFTRFAVAASLPFDKKRMLSVVRQNDWQIHEVKKRGVRDSPAQIQSWFRQTNGEPLTLVIAPTTNGVRAIFARREA